MKKTIIVIVLTALVFLSAVTLGVSTVYRINEVTVVASTFSQEAKREAEELQSALDEAYDKKSMFSASKDLAEDVLGRFPYFRITSFKKDYPNRLEITVSEDEEVYALPCQNEADGYYILNAEGIVLSIRDNYIHRSDSATPRNNLLITGLSVSGEKGSTLKGDTSLSYILAFCQTANQILGGIQSNIEKIDVIKGGLSEDTVTLRLTAFEGVKIYVRNPSFLTEEKAIEAINKYLSLSDSQRTMGMIAVQDTNGAPSAIYSKTDEFASVIG